MQDWQPIETAPKDGTQVIVCGRYSDDVAIARWDGRYWSCVSDGCAVIESQCDFGTEYRTFEVPSFWQPCPKPKREDCGNAE